MSLNDVLFHFCDRNPTNQEILYEYFEDFAKRIELDVNVDRLLA